jgi:hypothetical protein
MLTPEQEQLAEQLMDEALSLARDLQAHQDELLRSGLDAIEFIRAQQEASQSPGTVAKFGHILASNGTLNERILRLLDVAQGISRDGHPSYYVERINQVRVEVQEIDPAKIAKEDLLREASRRRDDAFDAPEVTAICIASAQIPIYFLAFAHSDIMRAYVNKPPLARRALDNASELVRAAALDFAGTAVPFLGTVFAIFQVTQPWIEREKRRMVEAIPFVDRLFNLDDGLTGLATFSAPVEESTRQVAEYIGAYKVSFADDIRWLSQLAWDARQR